VNTIGLVASLDTRLVASLDITSLVIGLVASLDTGLISLNGNLNTGPNNLTTARGTGLVNSRDRGGRGERHSNIAT